MDIIAIFVSCFCLCLALIVQFIFFFKSIKKLNIVKNFFQKSGKYSVYENDVNSQLDPDIAEKGSNLWALISELNTYTRKNHGTTDFSIIQNKTERKIGLLYDDATSKLAFPIYIGLMGTFAGVGIGLLFFTMGDGITDDAINNLIYGVLVSMGTSFSGLLLSTILNWRASGVRKTVDQDKSIFFEFIQTELMPTLGVSMVAALNKLHHTINMFEPSFTSVIDRFETTFDNCTNRFGNAFEQNVRTVSDAVRIMGENMDKINANVDLQAQLLNTLRSSEVVESLEAFVNAAQYFTHVTTALNRFEIARNTISDATTALVDTQKRYTESLEIPLTITNKLNGILDRITDFEDSINSLGKSIKHTHLFRNGEIELINEQITAIKKKQAVAINYIDMADGQLKDIFESQNEAIRKLNQNFENGLAGYAERFENSLERLGKEMHTRRAEIVAALEEKFSLDQIQQEFTQLHKLEQIENLLGSIDSKASREDIDNAIQSTRKEVTDIRIALDTLLEEAKKKEKGGGIFGLFGKVK